MKRALRAFGWTQVALALFCLYYALRPALNADTCSHPARRTDGPVVW